MCSVAATLWVHCQFLAFAYPRLVRGIGYFQTHVLIAVGLVL